MLPDNQRHDSRNFARREAARSLQRLSPRINAVLPERADRAAFEARLEAAFPDLFAALLELYGHRYDFFWHLERTLEVAARAWGQRPDDLRELDAARADDPAWFAGNRTVGAVCYVDRFAGDLQGVEGRLGHLRSLGVNYLHLMPLFKVPPGPNDGGYAVSSYREVNPEIGSMEGLAELAAKLRAQGTSLVLDFVLNHTADDHPWALAAQAGDPDFQDYYWMFDDRAVPDAFAAKLRAIFPDRGGDAFVWRPDVAGPGGGKHVWSTFYPFQWDLNYQNPAVLAAMAGEMLFLANQGAEVLRFDAVPFLWKQLGTTCENQPQAHAVVRALNAMARIAAPALAFKSEAIVHPDEVARYIQPDECRLSYNPWLMVLLWEALATRDTRLMRHCLRTRYAAPEGTAWVNYARGHDDIGWGFANEDAQAVGIDPAGHRAFLNDFYTGRFPGSFARGLPFQENPLTGDCRISGTTASLAGLEKALAEGDARGTGLAVRRILLLHGVIATAGGVPLIYLGDELAQINDHSYVNHPARARDNRWVHRPAFNEGRLARAEAEPWTPEGQVLAGVRRITDLRRGLEGLSGGEMEVHDLDSPHLLAFARPGGVLVLGNFSEHAIEVAGDRLARILGAKAARCRFEECSFDLKRPVTVEPYAFHALQAG